MLANGKKYTVNEYAGFASYLMQQEILIEELSVYETLEFVGKLKYKDPKVRKEKIEKIIEELGL